MTDFQAWIGRTEERQDRLDAARSNALLAALGEAAALAEGDLLPTLHHWLAFWDVRVPSEIGADGHPRRGGFLPPVPLERRLWAGSRLIFREPLRLGETVRRISTIEAIEAKTGRSGDLVFVTVSHRWLDRDDRLAIEEEQDLVYRDGAAAERPQPAAGPAPERSLEADPLLLFRYSALTMNGHRIHYDRPYAVEVERYPALVVHGPLQATLLAALAEAKLGRPLRTFRFRGIRPAFAGERLDLHCAGNGPGLDLWVSQQGVPRLEAAGE